MKRVFRLLPLLFLPLLLRAAALPPLRVVDATRTGFPVLSGIAYFCHVKEPLRAIRISKATPEQAAVMLTRREADLVIAEERDAQKFSPPAIQRHPAFAVQAVTICVHPGVPVNEITLEQLKKILSEPLPKWSLLQKDASHDIHLFGLKPAAPGAALMDSLIWGNKIVSRGRAFRADSSRAVLQLTAQDPAAFAVTNYLTAPPAMTKTLKVNGVLPTEETIRKRSYPLMTAFACFTAAGDGNDPGVQSFLNTLSEEEVRKLLNRYEMMPL